VNKILKRLGSVLVREDTMTKILIQELKDLEQKLQNLSNEQNECAKQS
jgi:hypothetical protein